MYSSLYLVIGLAPLIGFGNKKRPEDSEESSGLVACGAAAKRRPAPVIAGPPDQRQASYIAATARLVSEIRARSSAGSSTSTSVPKRSSSRYAAPRWSNETVTLPSSARRGSPGR